MRSLLAINLHSRATLAWGFAFPIGLTVLYGFIMSGVEAGGSEGLTWIVVGLVALNIMAGGMLGEAGLLTEMREAGLLQRLYATPLPAWQLVSAHILVRMALLIVQCATILAVARFGFGAQFGGVALVAGLLVAAAGTLVFFALGQAIGAVAPTRQAAFAIGQAIYFPLMFVSNLFIQNDVLPAWINQVARFTPAYLLVDVLRPAFVPGFDPTQPFWLDSLGLALYGAFGMLLVARFFQWEPRG
jgi:ABC-2 type transport system permease protein